MSGEMFAVCTFKPRPSVHKTGKGHQHWAREVYHLRYSGITTYCGRDRTGWLDIGPIEKLDSHCCLRCRIEFERRNAPGRCHTPLTRTERFTGSYADSFAA